MLPTQQAPSFAPPCATPRLECLPRAQKGLGLLSIMVAVALGLGVAGIGYTVYHSAAGKQRVSEADSQAVDVSHRIQSIYASQGNFQGLTQASALAKGAFSPAALKDGQPANPWGGGITVNASDAGGSGYSIVFSGVKNSDCAGLVAASASGFDTVNVQVGSQWQQVASRGQANTAAAVTACKQGLANGSNSVQFVASRAGASAILPTLTPCVAPSPQTQNVACPPGQVSSVSPYGPDGITQKRDAACMSPYGPATWGPWTPTGNTCAPICVAPAPTLNPPNGQTFSCPAGQLINTSPYASSAPQTQAVTPTTYACTTPVGPLTTTPGVPSGAWTPAYACAPACTAPGPSANPPASRSTACPAGQLTPAGAGSFTQTSPVSNTTYACTSPIGSVVTTPGTATGPWTPAASAACAPKCVAPASTPGATVSRTANCPSGYTTPSGASSFTQTATYSPTTYACPNPTGPYTTTPGTLGPYSPSVASQCSKPIGPPVGVPTVACATRYHYWYTDTTNAYGFGAGAQFCLAEVGTGSYELNDPSAAYVIVNTVPNSGGEKAYHCGCISPLPANVASCTVGNYKTMPATEDTLVTPLTPYVPPPAPAPSGAACTPSPSGTPYGEMETAVVVYK